MRKRQTNPEQKASTKYLFRLFKSLKVMKTDWRTVSNWRKLKKHAR